MQVKIHLGDTSKIVELFQVTFECAPDRFKSLRLSEGAFPDYVELDFKDEVPVFKEDFLVNKNEDLQTIKNMFANVKVTESDGGRYLKENWFCFPSGTPILEVVDFIDRL